MTVFIIRTKTVGRRTAAHAQNESGFCYGIEPGS